MMADDEMLGKAADEIANRKHPAELSHAACGNRS
jgi:hypothetical protein